MQTGENFYRYKFREWMRDFTALANPLILLLIPFFVMGSNRAYFILIAALVVNEILGSLIKIIFPKARPTGQVYNNTMEKIDAGSFPSLHAARTTLVYLSLFIFYKLIILKTLCVVVILIVGISRIVLKKHFFNDVIAGWLLGGLIFWLSTFFL